MPVSSPEVGYPTRRSVRMAREADVASLSASGAAAGPAPLPTRRSMRGAAAVGVATMDVAGPGAATQSPAATSAAAAPARDDDAATPSTPSVAAPHGPPVDVAAAAPAVAVPAVSGYVTTVEPTGLLDTEPAASTESVAVGPVTADGHLDAVIDTDGRGFPALSATSRLDWLAPTADPADDTAMSKRHLVGAWLSSVRTGVAGVDLNSSAVRRLLPQVGVIAVMAAATMGNAMAGQVSPTGSSIGGASTDFARAQIAILPGVKEGTPVTSDLDNSGDLIQGEDGVLRVRGADDASRGGSRDALPGCDGVPPEVVVTNGDVPEEYLCLLPNGVDQLRADAAEAFVLLNEAYAAETGGNICVSSGYRSFAQQAALRRQKPGLAARAGSSQHGNGLAVDLCGGIEDEGGGYWWLRENAPAFGFDNPEWARRGGSKYEPWHWEYVAGQW